MSEIADKNVGNLSTGHFLEDDSMFCLSMLRAYETDDPTLNEVAHDLLKGRISDDSRKGNVVLECNLGGCERTITESEKKGIEIDGACRAASYCLKQTFEAVGSAPTVAEGREQYRDILTSLHGFTSQYSAGNYCPRLECGLSAGLSEDMIPGTAGECIAVGEELQSRLEFEQAPKNP